MKSLYSRRLPGPRLAVLDVSSAEGIPNAEPGDLWLSRINVPREFRGDGIGSELLAEFLTDADLEAKAVLVTPNPTGPLDMKALISWYQRYCFVIIDGDEEGCLMKRKPT